MGSEKRRRPRLLIVTRDLYPPVRVDLTELFSRWLTCRFDIDWVMQSEASGAARTAQGRPGERFWISGSGRASWMALQVRRGVRVLRGEADLVQVRDAALSAVLFLLLARIARRPFVYWMSFPIVEDYRRRGLAQRPGRPILRWARLAYAAVAGVALHRVVLPHADHVFVQSARMKGDLVARGAPFHRMTAIPMGVSIDVYAPQGIVSTNDARLRGRRVLVYVGAIDPQRHIHRLVRALAEVAGAGFDAVLVIVGRAEGEDRRRIEAAADGEGVADQVVFTGHLPLAEALAYVRRADVCLAPFPVDPTYLSATPTKLVEYLAMGRPVVATDHPDQRRVIEDSGAGTIVEASAAALARGVIHLLRDPGRAEAMGARGPAWVAANRNYAVLSEDVRRVYDGLLASACE